MYRAQAGARPLQVSLPFRVQTYDIDFAGHVNNGVYGRWLEELRLEFLQAHHPLELFLEAGVAPVLVTSHVAYKRSIQLFEEVAGSMWCVRMGRATLTLEAEIRVGDATCATATQRCILLYLGSTRPARMPKALLERFLAECGA